MQNKEYSLDIGGKKLSVEFNNLAERAHGSCIVRYGNTVILATAVMSGTAKAGSDFLPLTVEYEEKFYASGQILGSRFVRREGRPSDDAILSGRIVDRTIRPLFDQWIRNEIQVIITVLSIEEDDPDVLAVLGASLALGTSNIPWNGPVSAIRIGKKKDVEGLIVNPNYTEREAGDFEFELLTCGKDGKINMIELGGQEIEEEATIRAMENALIEIDKLQDFQNKIIKEIGKEKKKIAKPEINQSVTDLFASEIRPLMNEYIMSGIPGGDKIAELNSIWIEKVTKNLPEENISLANELFEEAVNDFIHEKAVKENKRADGRNIDEIRPLFAKAGGVSPVLHGSGIFYRGQTHIFSALTLGGPHDAQVIDGMETSAKKRFMHHYNFPPFSTGETGRVGGTNRRMIGHGALAEKALMPLIPNVEEFPYTIRLVSEAFSSNGSTSMGSVCGSTLALMDGGVPIKRPVAGISSGVMILNDNEYKVLTDIQGPEDHYGDMDFKVAGTKVGITAIQMDVKVNGVSTKILTEALEKAKEARFKILDVIEKEISKPRENISPNAPKIIIVKVKVDQIGLVIGPGGKTINGIKDETECDGIDIEDDGTVFITGKDGTADKAAEIIRNMTREYIPGDRFEGEVTRIMEFGAFVKIGPNTEGLVHVSEIAPFRVDKVDAYLSIGQKVPVILKEIDEKKRLNLSIKLADPNFAKATHASAGNKQSNK